MSEYEHGRPKSQRGVCSVHVFDVGYLPRANFHASATTSAHRELAPGSRLRVQGRGFLRPLLVLPALVEGSGALGSGRHRCGPTMVRHVSR